MAARLSRRRLSVMKKIKSNVLLVGATALLLAAGPTVNAAEDWQNLGELYRAEETSLDLFASGSVRQESIEHPSGFRTRDDLELGAGVGLNHFFTRNFGLGGEVYSESTKGSFIDNASLNFIGRLPLGESGFAPYAYIGGGRQFDPLELSFAQVGVGMEYRFTPEVGVFSDVRYVLTDDAADHGLIRVGLRLAF
jgi:hypothetical protein